MPHLVQTSEALRIGLCIPTRNPGCDAQAQAASIASQSMQPDRFLVIDSSSTDGTIATYAKAGAEIRVIPPFEFNHGGTRQLGADLLGTDIVVFLTQDAILAGPDSLRKLVACFEDETIGVAYGRQLPKAGARAVEAHARLFNYPAEGGRRTLASRSTHGIKTVFLSNSFAAYRTSMLRSVGGFPGDLIMGEDTYVAAKILLAGGALEYCAEATVLHSHDYRWGEEFRRYFDTGVLHAREPWIRREFGEAGGEGWRFLRSEIQHVLRRAPWLLPSVLVRTGLKLAGFKLGLQERRLPVGLKRRLSMFTPYWKDERARKRPIAGR
jgi:rhamnosyltransferase